MNIAPVRFVGKGLTKFEIEKLARNAACNTPHFMLVEDLNLAKEYRMKGLSRVLDAAFDMQKKREKWAKDLRARLDALDN